MNLPFTVEQFLGVFADYNNAVWPAQVLLNLVAAATVVMAIKRTSRTDRGVLLALSFLWVWTGLVYHLIFFAPINPAAYGFGVLFIIQGLLFLWAAFRGRTSFRAGWGLRQTVGSLLIAYALVVYPLLGMALGHLYPESPTFGAPCPTTIFTFGVLLWSTGLPRYLLVIPAVWSVIGFTAALALGIREDIGLLVAGLAGTGIILATGRRAGARPLPRPVPRGDAHSG